MKKVIAKKVYDTDTARLVKKITHGNHGDPTGYEESLYQMPDGAYFIYVNGGFDSKHPKEEIKRASKKTAEEWISQNGG